MKIWSILSVLVLLLLLFDGYSTLSITAGESHTCALSDMGAVKCWGCNDYGQLGLGDTNPRIEMGNNLNEVDLGNFNIILLKAGVDHNCAVSDNGTVKCWGFGYAGALGQGNELYIGDAADEMGSNLVEINLGDGFYVIDVALGWQFTCALSDIGNVKCWGYNNVGQLGQGDTNNRGDDPNEMGDDLSIIDLGNNFFVTSLAATNYGVCALSYNGVNGYVKCWGNNQYGECGVGDINNRGDASNEMGINLNAIDFGSSFNPILIAGHGAGEGAHYCAVSDWGTVKCWGLNQYGELGLGDKSNRGDAAGEMAQIEVYLGNNFYAVSVFLGSYHTCAVSDEGKVKCWGWGAFGQLGTEATANLGDGSGEMGNNLAIVNLGNGFDTASMALGNVHTCAVSSHGKAKCFGNNQYGKLGLGDQTSRGTVANTMGDNLPVIILDFLTKNPTQTTQNPTENPSQNPSTNPSKNPTQNPTKNPSQNPTQNPTENPSQNPTKNPSTNPSKNPTQNPTQTTQNPTQSPTQTTPNPTQNPTQSPTQTTQNPTENPSQTTKNPSTNPSTNPTKNPSENPTKPYIYIYIYETQNTNNVGIYVNYNILAIVCGVLLLI